MAEDERRDPNWRELERIARAFDGVGDRPGLEVRMDRLERLALDQGSRLTDVEGGVRVLNAHATGHPLLDKSIAQGVVDHVRTAVAHTATGRAVLGILGKNSLQLAFNVVNTLILGAIAARILGGHL